jgi:hypothetical protein
MPGKKIHTSTQKFTEVVDFIDNVVIFEGGNASMIIEITASNFALLSQREQDTRIFSYASLLNALSFPVQILIRNKRMDITSYLKELDEIEKNSKATQLKTHIKLYRTFVHEMVTVNVVLNKSFYIVLPYNSLEAGVGGAAQATQKRANQVLDFANKAQRSLQTKASSVLSQLQKFAMSARILEREDLIKLFYDIYNEGAGIQVEQLEKGTNAAIITGGKKE